jgi:hypothetical protein
MKLVSTTAFTAFLSLAASFPKSSVGFTHTLIDSVRRSVTTTTVSNSLIVSSQQSSRTSATPLNMSTEPSTTTTTTTTTTTNFTPDVTRYLTGDRPPETKDYVMQQTMIRVKDPLASLHFYCDVLGFKLVMYSEFPQWGFNVYVRHVGRVNVFFIYLNCEYDFKKLKNVFVVLDTNKLFLNFSLCLGHSIAITIYIYIYIYK